MVFFDQNTPAGEWRAQARCCKEQNIALHRNIAFALAVADLLQLPDDLPLMPAVTAAMSIPIRLGDSASLAHLRAVARAAMEKTAIDQPTVFFATCARLIGPEVKLTIEQNYAGLTPAELALLKEVITAIEAGLPNAANRPPGEVFQFVLDALRQAEARTINSSESTKKRTALFAQAKFVNDLKDRFYNRMAKSLDFEF